LGKRTPQGVASDHTGAKEAHGRSYLMVEGSQPQRTVQFHTAIQSQTFLAKLD